MDWGVLNYIFKTPISKVLKTYSIISGINDVYKSHMATGVEACIPPCRQPVQT